MKSKANILLILLVALVMVVVAYIVLRNSNDSSNADNERVACTLEAKLCPDGSYVGRVGPNCEFAPCP